MTDSLDRFLQDLRFDLPPGLVERAIATASDTAAARRSGRNRRIVEGQKLSWAPALVAALLAIAIVATLLWVGHDRQAAPASPRPQRATPYRIPSPPSVAAGCRSVPRQWATSPPQPAKMLSSTIGWAYGPMRTTDGGLHWVDVSPPSVPGRTPTNDEFFLDGLHAWVAETVSSSTACVDHVVVFRTSDAGKTWQQSAPISVRFTDPADSLWTGEDNHTKLFDFVDAQHGWLLLGSGSVDRASQAGVSPSWVGAAWKIGDLYRTTDGGTHWTRVVTDLGSEVGCLVGTGMSFSSLTTGWIIGNCPGPDADHSQVLVTHDGGVTWGIQALPIHPAGSGFFLDPPVFFDEQHGLLFRWMSLLVTSDGGNTWNVRTLPVRDSVSPFDFINPSEGWAIGTGDTFIQCDPSNLVPCNGNWRLYHTNDGGKTWAPGSTTNLLMPATKYWPPAYLHFVDSKTGFLDPGGPVQGFFRTDDGGRTWSAVNGTIEGPSN